MTAQQYELDWADDSLRVKTRDDLVPE